MSIQDAASTGVSSDGDLDLGIESRSSIKTSTERESHQRMLVFCGVVGSGKTTLAQAMVNELDYARVNQDDLGSRRACEDIARMWLAKGKSVIIDRQNFDRDQRRVWIKLAKSSNKNIEICAVQFTTPPEECAARLRVRESHPTIDNPKFALHLLDQFLDQWVPPNSQEGFDRILSLPSSTPAIFSSQDIEQIMTDLDKSPKLQHKSQNPILRPNNWRERTIPTRAVHLDEGVGKGPASWGPRSPGEKLGAWRPRVDLKNSAAGVGTRGGWRALERPKPGASTKEDEKTSTEWPKPFELPKDIKGYKPPGVESKSWRDREVTKTEAKANNDLNGIGHSWRSGARFSSARGTGWRERASKTEVIDGVK